MDSTCQETAKKMSIGETDTRTLLIVAEKNLSKSYETVLQFCGK